LAAANSRQLRVAPAVLAAAIEVVRFEFIGGSQSWEVPAGVTSIGVEVEGAQGGGPYGGFGGRTKAILSVEPGQQLQVNVGGRGSEGTGGFNGGGDGGFGGGGFGGGGASDIRVSPYELGDRVVVAGGGGSVAPDATSIFGVGGSGGRDGEAGGDARERHKGGGGGTQTGGGASGGDWASEGQLGKGASGGYRGGAGGGGYYGGGGGGSGDTGGGGGGGSGYVSPEARDATFLKGTRSGHGAVTITHPGPGTEPVDPVRGVERFQFTGGPQLWRVPPGVTSIRIDATGAQGGGTYGGFGARVQATVEVTPGQLLTVLVGGQSTSPAGGFNGGGNDGFGVRDVGGGGASDVRVGGWRLDDRVVVAGGGGGAASDASSIFGMGGSAGRDGQAGEDGSDRWRGGGGGTQDEGGAAGGDWGSAGRLGQGAAGGYSSGAGGGGYYGGGSGGSGSTGGSAGGGGGGSSYATASAASPVFTKGYGLGHGNVTIAYPPEAADSDPSGSSATKTFEYSGAPDVYRVPAGATALLVAAQGAQGGNGGGRGGRTQIILPVSPGQLLAVVVGGRGVEGTGGFNGGGPGGFWRGVAGGGASDVRLASWRLEDRVAVAGGGGGTSTRERAGGGGGGGGLSGAAGAAGDDRWGGGGGGTQTAGGQPGGDWGGEGRLGLGGSGGYVAGAGGGGLYGGGGGGSGSTGGSPGGGGGGSGFAASDALATVYETGQRPGDGVVTVTPLSGQALQDAINALRDQNIRQRQTYGDPRNSIHGANPTVVRSDPVNTATGAYVTATTDAVLPGVGVAFEFARSYTSADTASGALGVGWTHSLAAALSVASNGDVMLRGEDGQQILYTRQADGSFAAEPGGRSILAAVDGGYELVRPDQVRYRFDEAGRLSSTVDRNDQGLTLAYGAGGLLETVSDRAGRMVQFDHDEDGHLIGLRLPDGRQVAYAYTAGHLTSVTDSRGRITRYTYDDGGRLASIVDARGHAVVRTSYGSDGRVVAQLDALGNRTTFDWDADTGTSTMTDARGHQWKDIYVGNVLQRQVDPLGATTHYTYDRDLNLIAVTDPRGKTTTMRYDQRGNLLEQATPLGESQQVTYNARNDVVSTTDGRGNTVTFDYDQAGNLVQMTEPSGAVTRYERDPAGTGLLASLTDPNGGTTRYSYDQAGNPIRTTTPLGRATTTSYDLAGRPTAAVDPRGNTSGTNPADYRTRMRFDAANRLTQVIDPLGNRTRYAYDAVGNLVRRIDAKGRATRYRYDTANRRSMVIAPDGSVTRYAYDAVGNLVRRIDAKGRVTQYEYDAANRRTTTVSPIGQRWTIQYDLAGNPTALVDAVGNATEADGDGTTTMAYDDVGRLTKLDYSNDTSDVSFDYDANGNRTKMRDGAGTETRTYNARNQLTGVTRDGRSFAYSYNSVGNLTRRLYPDGTEIDLGYDADHHLVAITSGGVTTRYTYDPAGNLTQTALSAENSHVETRRYDRASRLLQVRSTRGHQVVSDVMASLDPVGNPIKEQRPEGTLRYIYDARDRLTRVCFSSSCTPRAGIIRYGYDSVGNRIRERRTGVADAGIYRAVYNLADQLITWHGPYGDIEYAYDANGNQTAAGANRYVYDLANRLTSARVRTVATRYTYDGEGKRLTAATEPTLTPTLYYAWDLAHPLPHLAIEQDKNGQLLRRYLYGHQRISMTTKRDAFYYHHDRLGSVIALTSQSGQRHRNYSYEPFGRLRASDSRPDDLNNPIGFGGEYQDDATGLYHLRAREYDPRTGRFLQLDPLEVHTATSRISRYVYANNRPTFLTDPSGQIVVGPCASFSVGGFLSIFGGVVQRCVATDFRDWIWLPPTPTMPLGTPIPTSWGQIDTAGGGFHSPNLGVNVQLMVSTARAVEEHQGLSGYGGSTVGPLALDIFGATSCASGKEVGGLEVGLSTPGLEGHGGVAYSSVKRLSGSEPNMCKNLGSTMK
jgi:RHS repeat-associated protein